MSGYCPPFVTVRYKQKAFTRKKMLRTDRGNPGYELKHVLIFMGTSAGKM